VPDAAHDDPVAIDAHHLDALACVDQHAVGDDIDALVVDLRDARWPQHRRGNALPTQPALVAFRCRAMRWAGAQVGVKHQPPCKGQAWKEAQQHQTGQQRDHERDDDARSCRDDRGGRIAGPDHAQRQAAEQRRDAQRTDHAEARRDEDLDGQQHQADGGQQQFLPARQLHQPVAVEEQRQAADAQAPSHAEARRAQLDHDAQHAHTDQQRADDRVRQETHQLLGPVRRGGAHLRFGQAQLLEYAVQLVSAEVRHSVLQRLFSGQRQQLALFDDARHLDVGIHHRLGQVLWPLARLGGGAEFLAHVGRRLFLHRQRLGTGHADLHRRGRTDGAAVGHRDGLGGQRDQRAGRDGALVDEGHRSDVCIEQRVADLHGRIHAPAEGVDVQNQRRRAGLGSLVQHARHERRQPEIDDALDGQHVDHLSRWLRLRTSDIAEQAASQEQQAECQRQNRPGHRSRP
jgi:hypothetical protein